MMATAEQRLAELGLELPPPPAAVAAYEPWVRTGNLVVTSGQLPWRDGRTLLFKGSVGRELTPERGYDACQLATLNAIAQLKDAVGDLERVRRVVRLEGSVNVAPGHMDLVPKVLNGASDMLNNVFGDRGRHTRDDIYVPGNAAGHRVPDCPLGGGGMMDAPVTDALAAWPQWRRDELAANTGNGHVGTRLVAETAGAGSGT